MDFLPANLNISAAATFNGATATANSTSISSINLNSATNSLNVTGHGTSSASSNDSRAAGQATAQVIRLHFGLSDVSYTWSLTGQLSAGINADDFLQVQLVGNSTGEVFFSETAGQGSVDHVNLSGSGALPPGDSYRLQVDVFSQSFTRDGVPSNGSADFNFTVQGGTPTPTPIRWNNFGLGGSFQTATNWDPQTVPGSGDTAVFGLASAYSVDVGTAATERLEIRNSDVTFTNSNYSVGSITFDPAGILLDNSKLTLEGGTLNGAHALIGESAAARIDVVSFAFLNLTGSLRVGGPGNGILDISDNGNVVTGEGRIGTGAGGGEVALFGFGNFWSSGNLSVGFSGNGTLAILDGAGVVSEMGFVGFSAGSSGSVSIEGFGNDIGQGSIWTLTNDLIIGAAGTGSVELLDFGVLNVMGKTTVNGTLTVAGGALSSHNSQPVTIGGTKAGSVSTSGFAQGLPGRMNAITDLTAGAAAVGNLDILDGGFVSCTNAILGVGASGNFLVTGVNQDPSELAVSSQLTVGKTDLGDLIVNDGGQVNAHDLTAGSQVGGFGIVEVRGQSGVIPSTLRATENVILGLEGTGVLIIEEGGAVTCSSAALGVFAGSEGGAFLGIDNAPGAPAQWLVHGDMMIGGLAPGSVELHNNAALAVDGTLTVNTTGAVLGNGTLTAGTRLVNGGLISPGLSPGVIVVNGDYEQTSTGMLRMEVAGLEAGQMDALRITGTSTLDGTMEVRMLGNFLPVTGQTFDLLQLGGSVSGAFSQVTFPDLKPGFQFNATQSGGIFTITALNNGLAANALLNISTRAQVGTGDNLLIAGFIVRGNEPKKVLLRGIGPSLAVGGQPVPGRLTNPNLELRGSGGALIFSNDDWMDSPQRQQIIDSTIPPTDDLESAIVATT